MTEQRTPRTRPTDEAAAPVDPAVAAVDADRRPGPAARGDAAVGGSSARATSPRTTSRSSSTSPTSTATSTWTSRVTAPRSRSSGADLDQLVGRNGEVLEALQELTRLAVLPRDRRAQPAHARRRRAPGRRRTVLEGIARDAVEKVRSAGERVALTPMTAFERKVVHDAVAEAGLSSESEGADPERYVVVLPD